MIRKDSDIASKPERLTLQPPIPMLFERHSRDLINANGDIFNSYVSMENCLSTLNVAAVLGLVEVAGYRPARRSCRACRLVPGSWHAQKLRETSCIPVESMTMKFPSAAALGLLHRLPLGCPS